MLDLEASFLPICQHFIYGTYPKIGWDPVFSGPLTLPSDDYLQFLKHPTMRVDGETWLTFIFPSVRQVASSHLIPSVDDYKRPSFLNHTILMDLRTYRRIGAVPSALRIIHEDNTSYLNELSPLQIGDVEAHPYLTDEEARALMDTFNSTDLYRVVSSLMMANMGEEYQVIIGTPDDPLKVASLVLKALPVGARSINFTTSRQGRKPPEGDFVLIVYPDRRRSVQVINGSDSQQLMNEISRDIVMGLPKSEPQKIFDDAYARIEAAPQSFLLAMYEYLAQKSGASNIYTWLGEKYLSSKLYEEAERTLTLALPKLAGQKQAKAVGQIMVSRLRQGKDPFEVLASLNEIDRASFLQSIVTTYYGSVMGP